MKNQVFTAFALILAAANAWSINGHLFVANIAQDLLLENSPDSLNQALNSLYALSDYNATLTNHENDHPFVECSTFADDIKYHGGGWQADFHFVDHVYYPDNDPQNYDYTYEKHNVTFAILDIIQWLSAADDGEEYLDSYIYDYIQNRLYPGQKSVAESYALRLLIHYVGDLHQPFHTESQYSPEFPDGDVGANAFQLPYHYGDDELHAVWDHLIYSQHVNIARPINSTYWPVFSDNTLKMAESGSSAVADPSVYQNLDIGAWAMESYDIAITKYDGIVQEEKLPQWYIDENVQVCNDRVTLGGYRLAHIIEYMYPAGGQLSFLQ